MKMTVNEAFDKAELIYGIIKDIERGSSVSPYLNDIKDLLKEYHSILLNIVVEI